MSWSGGWSEDQSWKDQSWQDGGSSWQAGGKGGSGSSWKGGSGGKSSGGKSWGGKASGGKGGCGRPAEVDPLAEFLSEATGGGGSSGSGCGGGAMNGSRAGGSGVPEGLTVTGCQNATIGAIVRGEFTKTGDNHSKPFYKKGVKVDGLDVMLYYWDERDGAAFCGWWFGPKVGGDQVWAYHPDKLSPYPPQDGWKMLDNGPSDGTLTVTPQWRGAGGGGGGPRAAGLMGQSQSWSPMQDSMQKRKEAELKRYEDQKRAAGMMAIRKVLMKIKTATTQTMPILHAELDAAKAEHLDNLGPLKVAMLQEIAKALEQGQTYSDAQEKRKEDAIAMQNKIKADLEARKQQMEENKKKLAEDKARLEEEMKQKKIDAVNKAREAALKKIEDTKKAKADAEERVERQRNSVTNIRKALTQIRSVAFPQYDAAKQELEALLESSLEYTGNQMEVIKQEVSKILEVTEARMSKVREQFERHQEKKMLGLRLCAELEELVVAAESAVVKLRESAAFFDDSADLSVGDVDEISQVIEEGLVESSIRLKMCDSFVTERANDLKDPKPPLTPDEKAEVEPVAKELRDRIAATMKESKAIYTAAKEKKDKAMRHAWANDKLREMKGYFSKYATTYEDILTRREIQNFAMGEYNFEVTEDVLETIWRNIVPEGTNGVTLEEFTLTKAAIGIAREADRNVRRQKDRENARESFLSKLESTKAAMVDAGKLVGKMDRQTQRLIDKVKAPVPLMLKLSDYGDSLVERARKAVDAAGDAVKSVKQGLTPDLQQHFARETVQFVTSQKTMATKVEAAAKLCARFRECAQSRDSDEQERFRTSVLNVIKHTQRTNEWGIEQLFSHVDEDGDGQISCTDFVNFFQNAEKSPPQDEGTGEEAAGGAAKEDDLEDARKKLSSAEEDEAGAEEDSELAAIIAAEEGDSSGLGDEFAPARLTSLFVQLSSGEPAIPKEDFLRLIRTYYKCIKEAVVTDGQSLKDSALVRRLAVGEVIEILEGPIKDDQFHVTRVQGRMLKDGVEGWITVAGNRGTTFLQRGGHLFKVVKEIGLSAELALEADAVTKPLAVGEVLEMYEAPRIDATSGLTRMMVKVKSDGSVGWVTTMENPKKEFVQVL